MGTRNLTMVISNGETKVAQYGQWDGYPDGQGITIKNFLKDNTVKKIKEVLTRVKFNGDKQEKEMQEFLDKIGASNDWMDMGQSALYKEKYPLVSRDLGAGVLQLLMETKDNPIWLTDSTEFGGDSLFCEWAYVLDLDARVLEVHLGFNKQELENDARFSTIEKSGTNDEYYQVRPLISYSFAELKKMTDKEFVAKTEKASNDLDKEDENQELVDLKLKRIKLSEELEEVKTKIKDFKIN